MASTGKQYQNHAATIISWARQDHPASRQRNYERIEKLIDSVSDCGWGFYDTLQDIYSEYR